MRSPGRTLRGTPIIAPTRGAFILQRRFERLSLVAVRALHAAHDPHHRGGGYDDVLDWRLQRTRKNEDRDFVV
jgi:hypothetical protein